MPAPFLSWILRQVARFARIFAWVSVSFVALVAALAFLPGLVDWQAHKPRLAAALSSATGRLVSLDGPLTLALLPHPLLVVRDVRLGNAPGATAPIMLEAERLGVHLSWLALLQGRVEIVRLMLDEPRVVLEADADGKPNWWLPALESAGDEQPALLPLSLDRIEVRGGRLLNAAGLIGQPIEARNIDLVATFDALRGRAKIEGAAIMNGLPVKLALGLGTGASAQSPIELAFGLPGGGLTFTGRPGHRSDDDPLRGHLAIDATFLPEFVESLSLVLGRPPIRVNEAVLQQVKASGDVLFDSRRLTIDGLSLEADGERVRGTLAFAVDDGLAVSGRLSSASLDADRWLERLTDRPLLVPSRTGRSAASTVELPAPRFELTIEADAVRYRRDLVRDLIVAFTIESGAFHLKEARAVLPGDFRLHRRVGFEGDAVHPGYDGVIEVEARRLRQTLKWIGIDTDSVPADRLQTLQLKGRTRPKNRVVHVADAAFSLDGQAGTVTADIALTIPTVIGARLHLPRLDLDAYRLTGAALGVMGPTASTPAGTVAGEIDPPLIDIAATADEVIYRGEPARQVDAHVAIRGNRLNLRHVGVGALLGSQLEISGSVEDFGTAPRFDLTWRGVLADADRMIDYAGLPRFIHGSIGAAQLSGRSAGTLQEATVTDLSLAMLGATIAATGQVTFGKELRFEFPRWSLVAADIGRLVAVASGKPYRPLAEVRASGAFRGDARQVSFLGDLAIDGVALSGEVSTTLDARPRIAASLRAPRELLLDRWLPTAPASGAAQAIHAWANRPGPGQAADWPADLQGVDGTVALSASTVVWGPYALADFELAARLQGGLLSIDRMSGLLEGAAVTLSGAVDARRRPAALSINGDLRDINVPRAIAMAHTANDFGSDDLGVALEGRFSLENLALRAEGETLEAILLSASGSARYQGDIRPVVTRGSLSMASLVTGIGSLFSTQMGFASAVIENFVGRWIATSGAIEVAEGIITLREHTLRSPGAAAYITSRIDTRNGTLDTLIDLDDGSQGSIDYSMSLRGPFRDLTLRTEPRRPR